MNILVVGGGPGGLYASLLLKKLHPHYNISIVERNPEGATYGWGVVFSSVTLSAYREADLPSYKAITDQFVIWNPIDIHYRDRLIRCDGHTFAGMARRKLLNILTERCRELGITVTFEHELTDFSVFADYDLVIAADGVNSFIRNEYADAFKPTLRAGKARYIWLGTHRVFDAFTFIIRENEHGLFQVHAYPFDGDTSTFIVECDEATWRNAGLDSADEAQSIAYCETLFADMLRGHKLMSNKSAWVSFTEVKNKSWTHENIVLLGDAAHTAHFSIGSGTKLAMDGAIALANGFELHGDDIAAAINHYVLDRSPRVQMLQQAALESQTYFENLKQYIHLEPEQFTFHLLTRSGRLNYDNLRLRDARYVEQVDRQFGVEDAGTHTTRIAPPPLHRSFDLREMRLANRVAVMMPPSDNAVDGALSDAYQQRIEQLAHTGAALIITEPFAVSESGRITQKCPVLGTVQLPQLPQFVQKAHDSGYSKIALQLSHAGRRGATRPRHRGIDRPLPDRDAWPLLSASALPYQPDNQTPQAMTRADMDSVCDDFVRATRLADEAGFDMLLLNFAHGYLLASFLSPLTNIRDDDYGGAIDNRLRYPLEVFNAVRDAWPDGKPIAVAFTADDWADGGITQADAVAMARAFHNAGCDLIMPLAGQTVPNVRPNYAPGFLAPYSERIRNAVRVPTLAGGGIITTNQVNTLLAAGSADVCLMDL